MRFSQCQNCATNVHCLLPHAQDPEQLVAQNGGKPPVTMQSFTKLIEKVGDPRAPLPSPTVMPPPGPVDELVSVPTLQEVGFTEEPSTIFKVSGTRITFELLSQLHQLSAVPVIPAAIEGTVCLRSLACMLILWVALANSDVLRCPANLFSQGGESLALARLEDYLKDPKWVCGFEKPQTDPSAFLRPATTVLSPYLKFGCLSPRLFHQRLMAIYRAAKGQHSKPPVSLRGQLLWREFFYTVNLSRQPCLRPRPQI